MSAVDFYTGRRVIETDREVEETDEGKRYAISKWHEPQGYSPPPISKRSSRPA